MPGSVGLRRTIKWNGGIEGAPFEYPRFISKRAAATPCLSPLRDKTRLTLSYWFELENSPPRISVSGVNGASFGCEFFAPSFFLGGGQVGINIRRKSGQSVHRASLKQHAGVVNSVQKVVVGLEIVVTHLSHVIRLEF